MFLGNLPSLKFTFLQKTKNRNKNRKLKLANINIASNIQQRSFQADLMLPL